MVYKNPLIYRINHHRLCTDNIRTRVRINTKETRPRIYQDAEVETWDVEAEEMWEVVAVVEDMPVRVGNSKIEAQVLVEVARTP